MFWNWNEKLMLMYPISSYGFHWCHSAWISNIYTNFGRNSDSSNNSLKLIEWNKSVKNPHWHLTKLIGTELSNWKVHFAFLFVWNIHIMFVSQRRIHISTFSSRGLFEGRPKFHPFIKYLRMERSAIDSIIIIIVRMAMMHWDQIANAII